MFRVFQEVSSGALDTLIWLNLENNRISDEGMEAFSTALSSGSLKSLKTLRLNYNIIGNVTAMQTVTSNRVIALDISDQRLPPPSPPPILPNCNDQSDAQSIL